MAQREELRQLIFQQVAAIPCGKVASYGQIARLCGFPNHARFVGRTMQTLPEHSKIPWHRVVNSQGKLSFPDGSPQFLLQKTLLQQEGIVFIGNKIARSDFY